MCVACREKFQELLTKERELLAFLDAFPQRKAAKQDELNTKAEAITAVLDRLNKLQAAAGGALPSQGQFQQLKVCKAAARPAAGLEFLVACVFVCSIFSQ